jgi:PfaB family protein
MQELIGSQFQKMAIVGLDCLVSGSQELDSFERIIYEGKQNFAPINYNLDPSWKIPLPQIENLSPPQKLMLKVAENTLKSANLSEETKIAVILVSRFQSDHQNKLASYISQLWNATSPAFAEEKSVFSALDLAQKLLTKNQVNAVLIAAIDWDHENSENFENHTGQQTLSYDQNATKTLSGEGIGTIILQLEETAKQQKSHIYAVIDAVSIVDKYPNQAQAVTRCCQTAFEIAEVTAKDIGYIEVHASGIREEDDGEVQGLIAAYKTQKSNLTCALGSVKTNIGDTHTASGMMSLIKTALCLYHRYIPAVPQWTGVKKLDIWHNTPFYFPTQSKPWFLEINTSKRIAAINSIETDRNIHIILSETSSELERSSKYLAQMPYYLFPIGGKNQSSLVEKMIKLQDYLKQNHSSLSHLARQTFQEFQNYQRSQNTYAIKNYIVAILGRNLEELIQEINRGIEGIKDAFATGKDWQTPLGSYFTVNPLAKKGKIAYVYSGSFTSYIGLGRSLFRLFPKIYDDRVINNVYERVANIEKILYPRTINKATSRELEAMEQKLIDNPVAMLESEVGFAGLITAVFKNYFHLQPQCAFGYSLGETSMMLAQGIWTSFKSTSDYLNASPLFKTELSGPKNAVRQAWALPLDDNNKNEDFWGNYIVLCPVSRVKEAIKDENRVYIPLINTPDEVVIAGEKQACQRVIEKLQCDAFPTSIDHVIHCPPMRSQYGELAKMNTLPTQDIPGITFYSGGNYEPFTIDSEIIGNNIAKNLCHQLDFPRLINRVYDDNIRIFIEVGVGGNCSRWISSTLKEKEHLAVSLNRRGMEDHTSIVRALARLVSHQASLDLSPLYDLTNVEQVNYYSPTQGDKNHTVNLPKSAKIFKSILPYSLQSQYKKLSQNHAMMNQAHSLLLKSRQVSFQQMSSLIGQKIEVYQRKIDQADRIK